MTATAPARGAKPRQATSCLRLRRSPEFFGLAGVRVVRPTHGATPEPAREADPPSSGNRTCRPRATLPEVQRLSDRTGSSRARRVPGSYGKARSEGPKVLSQQDQQPMNLSADAGCPPPEPVKPLRSTIANRSPMTLGRHRSSSPERLFQRGEVWRNSDRQAEVGPELLQAMAGNHRHD